MLNKFQEERRPWGDQCAQYTGTWRLVPWVLDVARENDETDAFTLETTTFNEYLLALLVSREFYCIV